MTKKDYDYTWIYIGIALVIGVIIWIAISLSSSNTGFVTIKYRKDAVNITAANFVSLGRSDSGVKGAWYDQSESYMVIKLTSTYYQYCGMPISVWDGLGGTNSLYSYYQSNIKGNYDCRVNHIPTY